MNVIVHYPKSADSIRCLQKRVAMIHAQAVLSYIQKLSCSKEQKIKLIEEIKQSAKGS